MAAEATEVGVEVVEVVGVKDKEEEVREVQEIKVRMEVTEEARIKDQGVKVKIKISTTPTKHNVMLISHHLRLVSGTGLTGSPPTFVWSPAPAPGASSGSPSPTTNEVSTSSGTRKTAISYIDCCTLKRKK